ncbi:MAG: glycosyltransferase family 39 protein [Nitrospirota bacterium]|nr:glycosyltransferase family 39 protein [Nitrospirota bacterium]MDH4359585.1 glycosyltransferase family 39 protein [Nitrospirota bacterium]
MKPVNPSPREQSPILVRAMQWLDDCAKALRDTCERKKLLLLGGVSLVYFVTTSLLASRKPMWNDELFTYFIAQAPTLSGIWSALLTGADQNPFPFYVLTRWSLAVFGVQEWALRLPEMVGVWVAGLCVFSIVARQTEGLYGFVAMVFLFVTGANFYSFEARPYGLVLGFSALAWFFWLQATQGRSRKLTVPGLAASLASAVCSHYYAVFVFVPLGIGELVRSMVRRRVDWPIWFAMLSALSPLVFLAPLIEQARTYSQGFWARPSLHSIPEAYAVLLMPTPLLVLAVLLISGAYSLTLSLEVRHPTLVKHSRVPLQEVAVTCGFVVLPFIAIVATLLTTGAFTFRYALPMVLGVSVLMAVAFWRLFQGQPVVGVAFLLLLFTGFGMLFVRSIHSTPEASLGKVYELITREPIISFPVVISDAHSFMMLSQYAPHELSSRLVYLADPKASLRHLGYDTVDRGILDLKPWFGFHIEEYSQYLEEQPRFLVYVNGGRPGGLNWLLTELASAPYHIELRAKIDDHLLFLVTSNASLQAVSLKKQQ